jgi:hypothetical protein
VTATSRQQFLADPGDEQRFEDALHGGLLWFWCFYNAGAAPVFRQPGLSGPVDDWPQA